MNTLKRSALTALAYSAVCSLTSWTYLVLDAYGHTNDLDFFVWIGVLIIMALAYPFVEKRLIGEDPGSGESLQFGALFFALSIPNAVTLPESSSALPIMQRMVVVLPAPFCPTKPMI